MVFSLRAAVGAYPPRRAQSYRRFQLSRNWPNISSRDCKFSVYTNFHHSRPIYALCKEGALIRVHFYQFLAICCLIVDIYKYPI